MRKYTIVLSNITNQSQRIKKYTCLVGEKQRTLCLFEYKITDIKNFIRKSGEM